MSYGVVTPPPPDRALSRKAAIVGVGESDFHADYAAARTRSPDYQPHTVETLMPIAFERALDDCGLKREDIDGLSVSFTFGGPEPQDVARLLGVTPRYCVANGNIMAGPLPVVCAAIANGEADTVAMIFSVASLSIGRQFGGASETVGPYSYYYFHPWGWSSQAAHWAIMFANFQAQYGAREEDLGAVAVQVRKHAQSEPNAVMQQPMTIESYMASRYIVRPLHLFDICLVNDGAVCLIVRRADKAKDVAKPHTTVLVAGWGESKVKTNKMRTMVCERLYPQMQDAAAQALDMAGLSLSDVGHLEGYDASTMHLINHVEGFGFTRPGTGLDFCKDGQMTLGGRIPTNVSGGNLSGTYMQGWSQVAEVVRQLRHEAGPRQIPGLHASISAVTQTDQSHPIICVRGE